MKIKILPIEFLGQGAMLEPRDPKLHDMVVDYCRRELAEEVNLTRLQKVWAAVVMEGEEYRDICGVAGFVWKIDVPVFRVTGDKVDRATAMLVDRMRSFFEDNGARGHEAFIHISSKERPEQRCQKWEESLALVGAIPADRFSVKV